MLRPVQIRHYIKVMQARGFSPQEIVSGADIDCSRLDDPAYLLDAESCKTVVSNMIRLTGDQGIGLDVGNEARLTDFGIVAHAMISSKTLGEAIRLWMRYGKLVGMLIKIDLHDCGQSWEVSFSEMEPMGFVYNFCVEEMLVAGISIGSMLTDCPFTIGEICLSYPAPQHVERYREQFRCQLRFNSAKTSITILNPPLSTPLRSNDEELHRICLDHCQRVMRHMSGESDVIARLRSLLLKTPGSLPSLGSLAREMDTSERSLRRSLSEAGTSYRRLVGEFRADLAKEYLASGDIAPKEVAYLLGFKDANAFRRAFKTWTGDTIREFRERRGSGV